MDILLPLDHILENLQPPQPSADNKIWVPNDARRLNEKQETQLSLTSRATRLEISQGQQTWYLS